MSNVLFEGTNSFFPVAGTGGGGTGGTGEGSLSDYSAYEVYPDGPYESIQAAINAAVSDGHTSGNTSPAVVVVYPGSYTEDLTLHDGVHLVGAVGFGLGSSAVITGKLSYTPAAGSYVDATLRVANLTLIGDGDSALEVLGTNGYQLFLEGLYVTRTNGGSAPAVDINGAEQARTIVSNCIIQNETDAPGTALRVNAGTFMPVRFVLLGGQGSGTTKGVEVGASGNFEGIAGIQTTGDDAITVASGGRCILRWGSEVRNYGEDGNGVNLGSGGDLESYGTMWQIENSGTGKVVAGSGGGWLYDAANSFVMNSNYDTAISASLIDNSPTAV